MGLQSDSSARPWAALAILIAAGALFVRTRGLDERPMHCDEAVHAVKLGILLDTGRYDYNPIEFHGPTHYYFALPILWAMGVDSFAAMPDERPMRAVPALFHAALAAAPALIGAGLGWPAAAAAGVLTVVSPAMAYYGRYYIQETLLVFFSFAFVACAWRAGQRKRMAWILAAGAALGMMHATKETCLLAFASFAAAWAASAAWSRRIDGRGGAIALGLTLRQEAAALALGISGLALMVPRKQSVASAATEASAA